MSKTYRAASVTLSFVQTGLTFCMLAAWLPKKGINSNDWEKGNILFYCKYKKAIKPSWLKE
jgi:hypothetical protein